MSLDDVDEPDEVDEVDEDEPERRFTHSSRDLAHASRNSASDAKLRLSAAFAADEAQDAALMDGSDVSCAVNVATSWQNCAASVSLRLVIVFEASRLVTAPEPELPVFTPDEHAAMQTTTMDDGKNEYTRIRPPLDLSMKPRSREKRKARPVEK